MIFSSEYNAARSSSLWSFTWELRRAWPKMRLREVVCCCCAVWKIHNERTFAPTSLHQEIHERSLFGGCSNNQNQPYPGFSPILVSHPSRGPIQVLWASMMLDPNYQNQTFQHPKRLFSWLVLCTLRPPIRILLGTPVIEKIGPAEICWTSSPLARHLLLQLGQITFNSRPNVRKVLAQAIIKMFLKQLQRLDTLESFTWGLNAPWTQPFF